MVELKCKICGGKLEFKEGDVVGVCDSCGIKQALPKMGNDRKINLFDRADHFLRLHEYDRAMNLYEQILLEDSKEALAYWSLVLCRYGVEYVEDPQTKRRIPTIHRLQVQSLLEDDDYKKAIEYADEDSKVLYEESGNEIENIRKQILVLSQKESPYDVFICYKESDKEGNRTKDSVLANELYYELKDEGFKVFFSRITLENKLGENYESCIFSALHSAKVMVVIGTNVEHLNSVWVKNEWSRYLELIKRGEKKTLIPAYRDMDPYDLPEEFSHLQAQDMSKLGFMQDLIRGIKKICAKDEKKEIKTEIKVNHDSGESKDLTEEAKVENLLKRIEIFLNFEEWDEANEYCEKALDQDPQNPLIYLYKIMANVHVNKKEELVNSKIDFSTKTSYKKLMLYADPKLANEIQGYVDQAQEMRNEKIYAEAVKAMETAVSKYDYEELEKTFNSIVDYKDSKKLAEECKLKAIRRDSESSGAGWVVFVVSFFILIFIIPFLIVACSI